MFSSEPPSIIDSGVTELEEETVEELIPVTVWPGTWMSPQPDLSIDYENNQLHDILQSAKRVLSTQEEHSLSRYPYTRYGTRESIHGTTKVMMVALSICAICL